MSLILAIEGANTEIVRKFLDWGVFYADESNGLITLAVYSIASRQADLRMLEILYGAGIKDYDSTPMYALFQHVVSDTPVDTEDAKVFDAKGILDVLINQGMDVNNYTVNKRRYNILSEVLGGYIYHHYYDSKERHSIQYADWLKDFIEHAVAQFIKHDVYINEKDGHGQTPLNLAAAKCYPNVVEMLLKAGADPDISDKRNQKPVDRVQFVLNRAAKRPLSVDKYLIPDCEKTAALLN